MKLIFFPFIFITPFQLVAANRGMRYFTLYVAV